MQGSALLAPRSLDDLFLFRLSRLLSVGGTPVVRLCEGRYGITRREWRLILALAHDGPMLSSTLADRVHLLRGPTSKAVTEMVAKGLAHRRPRPSDRRRVEIGLTEAGRAIFDSLFPVAVEVNQDLLSVLSAGEVKALDSMMVRLQAQADRTLAGAVLPKADRRRGHE
jgi:DNA-binding MarR family transcriptional regulator